MSNWLISPIRMFRGLSFALRCFVTLFCSQAPLSFILFLKNSQYQTQWTKCICANRACLPTPNSISIYLIIFRADLVVCGQYFVDLFLFLVFCKLDIFHCCLPQLLYYSIVVGNCIFSHHHFSSYPCCHCYLTRMVV